MFCFWLLGFREFGRVIFGIGGRRGVCLGVDVLSLILDVCVVVYVVRIRWGRLLFNINII